MDLAASHLIGLASVFSRWEGSRGFEHIRDWQQDVNDGSDLVHNQYQGPRTKGIVTRHCDDNSTARCTVICGPPDANKSKLLHINGGDAQYHSLLVSSGCKSKHLVDINASGPSGSRRIPISFNAFGWTIRNLTSSSLLSS